MVLTDVNSKYKKDYKILTKGIVNKYVDKIKLYDDNEIYVIYKN